MNILFTTAHPAQVHNFRLIKKELEHRGHNVFWIATEKDISKYLLNHYGINYRLLKKPGKGFLSKAWTLLLNTVQSIRFLRQNKIDIIVSRVSPYLALAGFLANRIHISIADTESSGIYNKIFVKFTDVLLTPNSFRLNIFKNQIQFDGNIELFYLHPNRYETKPRNYVTELLEIEENQPYVIMRFVSWDAYHDKGLHGFSDENKRRAVYELSKSINVFISAEKELPADLEAYRISIPPERMHNVLEHASLFFGESATMASESAVLGTPAIYLDKVGRGYTDEEEQYGLVFNFNNNEDNQLFAINKAIELLGQDNLKSIMQSNRQHFLENKIDGTSFMLWFIENYPNSYKTMKENPNYLFNFK